MPRLPRGSTNLYKSTGENPDKSSVEDKLDKKLKEELRKAQQRYKILDDYNQNMRDVFNDKRVANYARRAVDEFAEVVRSVDEDTAKTQADETSKEKVNIPRVNRQNQTFGSGKKRPNPTRVQKENTTVDTSAKKADEKKATSVEKQEEKREIDIYELLKDYARNSDTARNVDDFDIFFKATNRMSKIENVLNSLRNGKLDANIVFYGIPLDELKSNGEASVITSKIESILKDFELVEGLDQNEKVDGIQELSRKIQELESQVEKSPTIRELKERPLNEGRKKSVADLTKQALMSGVTVEDIRNAENQLESATKDQRNEEQR